VAESALGSLLAGVTGALTPLRSAFADPVRLSALLRELDPQLRFDADGLTAELEAGALRQLGDTIAGAVDDGIAAIADLDGSDAEQLAAVAELITVIARLVAAVDDLPDTLMGLDHDALGLPPHARTRAYWVNTIAGPLASRLLADRLQHRLPALYQLLVVLGAIDESDPARRISLDALGDALADPAATLRALAGWGSALDGGWITNSIADLAGSAGLPARIVTLPAEVVALVGNVAPGARAVAVPIASGIHGEGLVEAGLLVLPTGTALALTNITWGTLSGAVELPDPWTATVTGELEATAAAGVLLEPGGVTSLNGSGHGELAVTLAGEPDDPWLLFGTRTSTRLELARIETGVTLVLDGDAEAIVHAALVGGNLVVVAGDALTRVILGAEQVEVPFDLEARWSSASGFSIGGAVGLVFVIPLDRTIGIVTLRSVELSIGVSGDGLALGAGVALDGALGPFKVTAEGMGLELSLVEGDGVLGPFDAAVGFLPPSRIGLALDAEVVSGGGVIDLDPANGRYSGAVSLDFLAIGIDAMGVIDTRLPSGSDGWALFASLSARFPGLPLGFGFTLLGLGGIIALNRSVDGEALAGGLREGAVDALLFPDDPVGDAALILSQIDEYFPLADGNTVIGPVIQIGWGAPTLITAELGVVLSLPQGVIVILGSIQALLPYPDAPVLELRMDALGVIDVPGGTLTVTASLYDSRLLGVIELSGDMALYLSVLENPFFLLSIGGYHPGYQPPSFVPESVQTLREMRAEIELGPLVEATLTSYFAVTSNSVQFGGAFNITATVEFLFVDYTASGFFDFDVLFEFDPFRIVADVAAGCHVTAGGKELWAVDLEVHVEGPDPWFASCHASFKFFLVNVKFDFTVGAHALPDPPESADVLELMDAQLDLPAAWSVETPAGIAAGLVLRDEQADSLLRPDSRIVVRQTVAPLNRDLDAYGNCTPEQSRISVTGSGIRDAAGGSIAVDTAVEQDWFAPSQYSVMRDEQRLSAPNYELMDAGVSFGAEGIKIPARARDRVLAPEGHETRLWTGASGLTVARGVDTAALVRATQAGATARKLAGVAVEVERMSVAPTTYVIVDSVDGAVVEGEPLDYVAATRAAGGDRIVPAHVGVAA
jgi:hypothetical protein